jgi:CRISPR type III-A-associated RAMP protein Csm5
MEATLKTLTPVHIGNGVTYNKGIDFIQKEGFIGIIDEIKVLDLIGQDNIKHWVTAIEKFNPETDFKKQPIIDLLEARGIILSDINKLTSRSLILKHKSNNSSQLKEHFRSPLTGLVIPGSSLKGSIRTCIMDNLVENKVYTFNIHDIKNEREDRKTGGVKIDWKFDTVDRKLFGENANLKSTRFIQIGDIHFPGIEAEVYEIKILNKEYDGWRFKTGQQFLIETIPAGAESVFHLKVDNQLLDRNTNQTPNKWPPNRVTFLYSGARGFCKLINEVTTSLIEWELDVLENENLNSQGEVMLDGYEQILKEIEQCEPNEFILRVGANNGWVFMTAGWWRRYTEDGFSYKDLVNLRKKIQKRDYSEMGIWPKTRKISSTGQIFGFVKVILPE